MEKKTVQKKGSLSRLNKGKRGPKKPLRKNFVREQLGGGRKIAEEGHGGGKTALLEQDYR